MCYMYTCMSLNISLTFSIFRCLNNGSVWASYLLFVFMWRARFCSLNILPQHVMPNCWWNKTKVQYMSSMVQNWRYRFHLADLFMISNVPDILLAVSAELELEFINSFIPKPGKLKHEIRSICSSFTFKSEISSFSIRLFNIMTQFVDC